MANPPEGYILLSAPIYAQAKGQIRPFAVKTKHPFEPPGCILKGKTCPANLSDELRSDQQNANAQLIQCTYAAFPYQTLLSMLRPCLNAKLSISPVKKKKIPMELSECKLLTKYLFA